MTAKLHRPRPAHFSAPVAQHNWAWPPPFKSTIPLHSCRHFLAVAADEPHITRQQKVSQLCDDQCHTYTADNCDLGGPTYTPAPCPDRSCSSSSETHSCPIAPPASSSSPPSHSSPASWAASSPSASTRRRCTAVSSPVSLFACGLFLL